MATARLCSIEGCDKTAAPGRRSMCLAHYKRERRHGSPHAGRTPNGDVSRFIQDVVLLHELDECLTWPFSKTGSGYGQLSSDGRLHIASRFICELAYGPAPTPIHEAAHSCGRGHLACVAKRHLSWKLPAENSSDKFAHGTAAKRLTESEAREILGLKGSCSQADVAKRFGVSRVLVGMIQRGKSWAWL